MRIPLRVICDLPGEQEGHSICEVDKDGFGGCGDGIVHEDGVELCLWVREVLEWQAVKQKE